MTTPAFAIRRGKKRLHTRLRAGDRVSYNQVTNELSFSRPGDRTAAVLFPSLRGHKIGIPTSLDGNEFRKHSDSYIRFIALGAGLGVIRDRKEEFAWTFTDTHT